MIHAKRKAKPNLRKRDSGEIWNESGNYFEHNDEEVYGLVVSKSESEGESVRSTADEVPIIEIEVVQEPDECSEKITNTDSEKESTTEDLSEQEKEEEPQISEKEDLSEQEKEEEEPRTSEKEEDISRITNDHFTKGARMVEHAFTIERSDPSEAFSLMERGCIELLQARRTVNLQDEQLVRKVVDKYIHQMEMRKKRFSATRELKVSSIIDMEVIADCQRTAEEKNENKQGAKNEGLPKELDREGEQEQKKKAKKKAKKVSKGKKKGGKQKKKRKEKQTKEDDPEDMEGGLTAEERKKGFFKSKMRSLVAAKKNKDKEQDPNRKKTKSPDINRAQTMIEGEALTQNPDAIERSSADDACVNLSRSSIAGMTPNKITKKQRKKKDRKSL